ncbi:uncharacterized protein A1O5_03223 [Cladophialophora psammophila CBS 110553]|uniref:Major facilitator superfamily (MFS) profile domain-containing protein n=1 Tax=Cladophialophora psammophila CBS 110553 TaxID=1182543 RepID=W9WZ31_9EURO|nr:uncharacterized protein A1O5_03223 [Cladophialophora psammophila CBS 110553]EXJ73462.1 hypothetical protein A1O5_03223 [Cladophialophora psammophila CBS 110553]
MSTLKEYVQAEGNHIETASVDHDQARHELATPIKPQNQNIALQRAAFEGRKIDVRTALGAIALAFTYEACILSFALPSAILLTINADIGPSAQIVWGATAWSLAAAVLQTIAGRCSDIFGRRKFILAGNVFGLVELIVESRAQAVSAIIAGFTLTGVAAGAQLLAFACAGEIVPKKWRGQTLAAMNCAALPGSCFGSVIAYALVAHMNWRWAFYVGIMANSIALILSAVFYWPPGFLGLHPEGKTRWQQFKEIDFVGLFLFGGGLTVFLLGVSWGNNPYSWKSAQVLTPLVLGAICCLVALPLWEAYGPNTVAKLFPPQIFKNIRGFCMPLFISFASGMLLIGLPVFWPQEVQQLFTTVPQTVGWYSLAWGCPSTVGSALGGYSWSRFKHTRFQFTAMTALMAAFMATVSSVTPYTPARAVVLFAFSAAFVGATCLVGILELQFGAADGDIGIATGLMGTSRATGGAIAIALFGSIIRNKTAANLAPELAAAVIAAGLPKSQVEAFIAAFISGSPTALESIEGVTPGVLAAAATAAKYVFADAYKLLYLVTLSFGVPAIVAAALSRSCDDKLTSQVPVRLDAPHLLGQGKGEALVLHKLEEKPEA